MAKVTKQAKSSTSQPELVALSPEKRQELLALFLEFSRTYLPSLAGQQQLAAYEQGRAVARTNYALITAAAARGQDVTDRILLQLLPYIDSASNRQKGAWVHVAPAITGDVRKWYEAKRWTQPRSWPVVAQAILRFVQRCERAIDELPAACRDFVKLTYTKGFQTGTLTPILNALHPDTYALITNKSRRVVNYFAQTTFTQSLADYPAANEAWWQLLHALATVLPPTIKLKGPLADLFDLFCHWLVALKKYAFHHVHYWLIALSEQNGQWGEWCEGGFMAVGWDELGDLSGLSRAEFLARRNQLLGEHPEWSKRAVDQVWTFVRQLREGDRIVVKGGAAGVLGLGLIAGAYYFVPGVQHGHCLPVEWDDTAPRQLDLGPQRKLLTQINRAQFEQIAQAPTVEALPAVDISPAPAPPSLRETPAPYQTDPVTELPALQPVEETAAPLPTNPVYPLAACAQATSFDEAMLRQWVSAIQRKGQAIIYGPPGTGKTFLADQLARHLSGGGDGCVEMVQFHPSYAYEDFIQGIRPRALYGQLAYEMVPGRFLTFCHQAAQRTGACVLIIDEMNRANLARVFGELMVLLEYREKKIALAGSDERFGIPPNVYLIGTMNTADRSLALVDYALRRRFAFLALEPNYAALRTFHQHAQTDFPIERLIALLERINQQIGDRHYAIGISFFMRPALRQEIADIWQLEIEPYLEEYFFDNPEYIEEFRWAPVARALGLA